MITRVPPNVQEVWFSGGYARLLLRDGSSVPAPPDVTGMMDHIDLSFGLDVSPGSPPGVELGAIYVSIAVHEWLEWFRDGEGNELAPAHPVGDGSLEQDRNHEAMTFVQGKLREMFTEYVERFGT